MAKPATARTVDLEPIDRLEDKIKLLVNLVTELRDEQAQAARDRAALNEQIELLRAKLVAAEGTGAELLTLREERDVIRERVADMLSQLEAI